MENRRNSRVAVTGQCRARFQTGGKPFNNIEVANLGRDGCCLTGTTKGMEKLTDRVMLENLELIHPGLPKDPVTARVVWVDRHGQGVSTGVQFIDAKPGYLKDVGSYVSTMSAPGTYGSNKPPIPD